MFPPQTIEFSNQLEEVTRITAFVEELCEASGVPLPMATAIQLAIEEAAVNVISYAYPKGQDGTATLSASYGEGRITFVLRDAGTPFDPMAKADPDLTLSVEDRPVGGLGILLVKKIMDHVTYQRLNNHNELTMIKNI